MSGISLVIHSKRSGVTLANFVTKSGQAFWLSRLILHIKTIRPVTSCIDIRTCFASPLSTLEVIWGKRGCNKFQRARDKAALLSGDAACKSLESLRFSCIPSLAVTVHIQSFFFEHCDTATRWRYQQDLCLLQTADGQGFWISVFSEEVEEKEVQRDRSHPWSYFLSKLSSSALWSSTLPLTIQRDRGA